LFSSALQGWHIGSRHLNCTVLTLHLQWNWGKYYIETIIQMAPIPINYWLSPPCTRAPLGTYDQSVMPHGNSVDEWTRKCEEKKDSFSIWTQQTPCREDSTFHTEVWTTTFHESKYAVLYLEASQSSVGDSCPLTGLTLAVKTLSLDQ
jgi:hypothetical protein